MSFITRDTPKDSWPRWIATLVNNATIDKIYPLLWKEQGSNDFNTLKYFLYSDIKALLHF